MVRVRTATRTGDELTRADGCLLTAGILAAFYGQLVEAHAH